MGFAFKATKDFTNENCRGFPAHLDDTLNSMRFLPNTDIDDGAVVKAAAVQEGEDAVISPPVAT